MGIVSELLLLPFTAPVRGFGFFLERIRDEAEAVLFDEGRAFAELIDLSMRHTAGQVSDGEFAERETELLERLSSIRENRDEMLDAELDGDDEYSVNIETAGEEEVS
jgi:Gas vesicle protein G